MQVKLARYRDQGMIPVAIKESQTGLDSWLELEASVHASLSNPRIVPFFGVIPSEHDDSLISGIVTAHCSGGSLDDWLSVRRDQVSAQRASLPSGAATPQLLPRLKRLQIAAQILEALEYMHASKVCHLDIKPGNVFLGNSRLDTNPDVMLGDFGLSRRMDGSSIPGRGTRPYVPPEMELNEHIRVHQSLDMWSLGVVFLDLVCDDPSGLVHSPDEMKNALQSGTPHRSVRNVVGVHSEPDWLDLVEMCLHYSPYERPTAGYLLKIVRSQIKACSWNMPQM
jgi:serine/threonine protein kinase